MNHIAVLNLVQLLLKNYKNLEVMEYSPKAVSKGYNLKLKIRLVIEGGIK